MAPRPPRGYQGLDHETIGSDILAVLDALVLAEQVLGKERVARLRALSPTGWYPIATLLEPLEVMATKLGAGSLKSVGWKLFTLSHAEAFKANARSVKDLVYGIDGLYHRANRGDAIGGWQVLEFMPGLATLEKTTPHHCIVEEGILEEGLRVLGVPGMVSQTSCLRAGADSCVFRITSFVHDARWTG